MNDLNYAWQPSPGWSGACLIDTTGKVYPCQPCEHEVVSNKVLGISAWSACRLGWIRIGSYYAESRKPVTDGQHEALTALFALALHGKTNLARIQNCLLRMLSGEVGEFFEEEEIMDDRLTGTCL